MSVRKIKKNDMVIAVSGSNAGKSGKVLQVIAERQRAIVEGLNIVKKHMRKSQDQPEGGIIEKEAPIALSNLMLYCPDCKKGVRTVRVRGGDKAMRRCVGCERSFDD